MRTGGNLTVFSGNIRSLYVLMSLVQKRRSVSNARKNPGNSMDYKGPVLVFCRRLGITEAKLMPELIIRRHYCPHDKSTKPFTSINLVMDPSEQ